MSDDIEAFLRQSAQRRADRKQPRRRRESEPIIQAETVSEPALAPAQKTPPALDRFGRVQQPDPLHDVQHDPLLDDSLLEPSTASSSGFGKSTTPHLQLSDLSQPAPSKANVAEIAELLRHPKNLRQAIILSEILRRPERWF